MLLCVPRGEGAVKAWLERRRRRKERIGRRSLIGRIFEMRVLLEE